MESDVPLIEIAEEDDSLLQLIQDDNVSSSNRSKSTSDDAIFFCSPLQPRRSKPVVANEKSQKPSSPSCRDSTDKENKGSNANKIEEQKLSLQPQQMKRKKGGGYNLRKSLAWDRAFFTDEGVLNSEELSLISGSANSNGLLSVIHEDTNSIADSEDLEVIEEKLFKVLPESPSSKDRTVGGSLLPKHDSSAKDNAAPGSAAKRKVLSARDINRSGSKRSGCPRPLASSSLKRPANVNTMKSPIKEPRISTLPVRKPDPCLLSRTSKNVMVGTNDLRRNQIAQPARKLNNKKTGPNNAKVAPGKSLTSKSSVQQARRNVASLVKGSPTKIPCPPAIEANNGFKVISKQTLPSTGHASYGHDDRSKKTAVLQVISKQALPSTGHASYGRNDRSRKTAAPEAISKQALPSTGHATYGCDDRSRKPAVPLPHTGVNLSRTQLPTSKPSGLRMPSPSLSFFHQPKASSLPSPLKTSSQPCIIPNLRQVGSVDPIHELRPPSSLGKKQNVIDDRTVIGNINVQCSSSGCSVSSTINSATKDKVEPFSQVTNMQKVELKVQSRSNSYDMTENQLKFNSIPVHENQQSMGEVEFQRNDDKFLLQGGSCEQLVKDDNSVKAAFDMEKPHFTPHLSSAVKFPCFSGENNITVHQLLEDKSQDLPQKNCGVLLRSKSEEASSSGSVLISHDDQSSSDHNVNELRGAEADLFKPMTSEGNQISDEDQMIWENTGSFTKECQVSEEIQSYSSVKVADVSPKVQNSSASVLKRSDALSDSRFKNQEKDDGSGFNTKSRNPHVEDAQMLALGGRFIDEMNDADLSTSAPENCGRLIDEMIDVDLSTSAPENCQLVITDCGNEKPEQPDLPNSCYVGEQVSQENKLHLNDCVLDGFSIFPEESQQKFIDSKGPEGTGACRSESEASRTVSQIPHGMLDFSSNVAELVESQNVDNTASVSESNETVVESYNLDSQSMSDFQLHCQDCSLKLDSVGDFTSMLNVKVQVEGGSAIKDVIEPKDFGTKDCNLPVESCYGVPQLQTEDDKSFCLQDTSVEQSDKINLSGIGLIREYQDINPGSCLNETLLANNASCKVFEETVHEVGLDDCDACGIESKSSKVAAAIHDGRPDLEEKADYLQMEVAVAGSFKIEPSSENLQSCTKSSHDNKLSNQAGSVESDVSAKTTNEENSVSTLAYSSCEGELCSSVISDPRSSSGRILQEIEVNVLSSKTLAEESEINILEENHTLNSELQHEFEDTLHPTEDNDPTKEFKKSGSDRKQDAPVIKLPPDAVPFSDEWLAALEAAGEEILTKKSGAVQNSPPNKSEPQIGPWSPVKRKTNQVIGPFDCTKHTNNVPPSSQ